MTFHYINVRTQVFLTLQITIDNILTDSSDCYKVNTVTKIIKQGEW